MPAFYRTSEAYSTIDFPADPGDNDVFEHPGGWQYQYMLRQKLGISW
jgi:hypothetical protein